MENTINFIDTPLNSTKKLTSDQAKTKATPPQPSNTTFFRKPRITTKFRNMQRKIYKIPLDEFWSHTQEEESEASKSTPSSSSSKTHPFHSHIHRHQRIQLSNPTWPQQKERKPQDSDLEKKNQWALIKKKIWSISNDIHNLSLPYNWKNKNKE